MRRGETASFHQRPRRTSAFERIGDKPVDDSGGFGGKTDTAAGPRGGSLCPKRRFATVNCRIAKVYSITSSALASKDGGTERPSALAVVRLSTNCNLVGRCTGKSAGIAPFKICPV